MHLKTYPKYAMQGSVIFKRVDFENKVWYIRIKMQFCLPLSAFSGNKWNLAK